MKKLEKELYIKHAKRLCAIIDEKSTFASYLARPDFNNVIKTQLNVLNACEKLFPKIDLDAKYSSKVLVKTFNKITKDKYSIDENYKYEDQTDLIDSINYLFTFCNNMFKVNLDDLVSGKKVTATDPKIDLRAKAQYDDEGTKMNSNYAFAGAGIPLASTPYENPYLLGKAYAKLNDDMKEGKFYRYKTQPKIIPTIKLVSCILMCLLSLGLITMAVFAFLANGLQFNVDGKATPLSTISYGVVYILLALFMFYPIVVTMKTIVGKASKNLNLMYHYAWGFTIAIIALSLLMIMLDLRWTWLPPYDIDPSSAPITILGHTGWKIMFLVCCGLIVLNVIPVIIGSVCNPKPDPAAVEKKVKEYVDMFAGDMPTNGVPPKADVQKPTDVKKSKSKDTKKKNK